MATAYEREIETAKRMIARKGAAVTWRSTVDPTPNPAQPWKSVANDPEDHSVKIVFLPASERTKFAMLAAGTDVPEGMEMGLMAAVDFEPSTRDSVIRNAEALKIVSIDPVQPDGTPILYIMTFGT